MCWARLACLACVLAVRPSSSLITNLTRVAPLSDEAAIGAEAEAEVEALEAEVEAELGSLARLGALLLSGASLSEEAAATLEAPALLLRRHAQRKAAGAYAEAAARVQTSEAALRRQSLSLAACELVQLPPQVAAAALATTSGAARLRLLLAQLRPIVAEMSALQALGALGDPRVAGEGLVSGVPGQPWKLRAAAAEAEAEAEAGAAAACAAREALGREEELRLANTRLAAEVSVRVGIPSPST